MKRLLLLAFSIIALAACNKSGTNPIIGQWELSESDGGLAGNIKYAPGNGNIMGFDNGGTYTIFQSGSPVLKGTYKIARASPFLPDYWLYLTSPGINAGLSGDSVRITDNKLIFLTRLLCCDEPTIIYLRK